MSPVEPVAPVSSTGVVDTIRDWLGRFICPLDELDLDLLTLWTLHTHCIDLTYTTPRLVVDSPLQGAGKTTVLEHLARLCLAPVQMGAVSTPASLVRMLDAGPRTILIDEVDRNLNPDRDGVGDLLAVLNTGYKKGASRPVTIPDKSGGWIVKEMPTFAAVAMAGITPHLPDDTRSRTITMTLLPDEEGTIEDSDWELIEPEAQSLGNALNVWAQVSRQGLIDHGQPSLPVGTVGRMKEKWRPLKRVAVVAGGRWPTVCDALIQRDLDELSQDKEEGLMSQRPAIALLRDMHELWPGDTAFWETGDLLVTLTTLRPERWGATSPYGRELNAQRLGSMLGKGFRVRSTRLERHGPRGYTRASFEQAWRRLRMAPAPLSETGATGAAAATGAEQEVLT